VKGEKDEIFENVVGNGSKFMWVPRCFKIWIYDRVVDNYPQVSAFRTVLLKRKGMNSSEKQVVGNEWMRSRKERDAQGAAWRA
jgi:hypothetical protein